MNMMQEQMMMLKSRDEPTSESVMPPALLPAPTRVLKAVGDGGETKEQGGHENSEKKAATGEEERSDEDVRRWEAAEDRAAKIERLKSGFRICQPQGTFIWPKMMSIPDDHIVVPTPSSASSSSFPEPSSLVKPLAERRPISPATLTHVTMSFPSFLSHTPPLINLNEAPPNYDPSCCAPLPYQSSFPAPMQPRSSIAAEKEAGVKKEKEMENVASSILERKEWWNVTMHGGLP